jgi:hypothetical protein
MGRTIGSRNKNAGEAPATMQMSPEERLQYLANLIIDRLLEESGAKPASERAARG